MSKLSIILLALLAACCTSSAAALSFSPLKYLGVVLKRVPAQIALPSVDSPSDSSPSADEVDLGQLLQKTCDDGKLTLLIFSTYAADFNAIEYAQKLKHYLPDLKTKGVGNVKMIVNAEPEAARLLCSLTGLEANDPSIEVYSDPSGSAGREFGVNRGWLSSDEETSPYLKLFGMLFGLGAAMTLPSVVSGYIGNPWGKNDWIESALRQGTIAGRFPTNAVEISADSNSIVTNKFDGLPLGVGKWGRRPLELATLRLQNMIGISLSEWQQLRPSELALKEGVLTQLGGCVLISGNDLLYEFKDDGICHTADFVEMLKVI